MPLYDLKELKDGLIIPCSYCKGKGKKRMPCGFAGTFGYLDYVNVTCPMCSGQGKLKIKLVQLED